MGDTSVGGGGASGDARMQPYSIDEAAMRALNAMDCSLHLMDERLKQCIESARAASHMLKKRAALEEEYAHGLKKITRASMSDYSGNDVRAGTYGTSWMNMLKNQDVVCENHFRFASKLTNISDDLAGLVHDAEQNRRRTRDLGLRLEKTLLDAESSVDRARHRFDAAAEDFERVMLIKHGDVARATEMQKRSLGMSFAKGGLFKTKNPQQMLRQEDEFRTKRESAHDALRSEAHVAQSKRVEYFQQQLPQILRSYKEALDELDTGVQFQLMRYAFLYESIALGDGLTVNPLGDKSATQGLRDAAAAINNKGDFKDFMQNFELVFKNHEHKATPHRQNPYDEVTLQNILHAPVLMPAASASAAAAAAAHDGTGAGARAADEMTPSAPARAVFGVDLDMQMSRDGVQVPPILEICADAIERVGIQNIGIYRLSGTTSRVQKLKSRFDADWSTVDVMANEAIQDINVVAGCLKQWFRELPEPLLTYHLYPAFIEAAKIENDFLRQVRLHEQVNNLPDANYATLRFLMAHLDRIRAHEADNQMSAHNLAIVFGPTLLRSPHEAQMAGAGAGMGGSFLPDMNLQCKAIETILVKYRDIFVEADEE